jgi:DNA-binding response OmpR family regulator
MAERRQILLVQDEMMEALIIEDALADARFDAVRASTAKEALELAATGIGNIAFAIINLSLRGGDGKQLLDDLRRLRPGLPALITTGHAEEHVRRLFGSDGTPVLRKPYSSAELMAAVTDLIGR